MEFSFSIGPLIPGVTITLTKNCNGTVTSTLGASTCSTVAPSLEPFPSPAADTPAAAVAEAGSKDALAEGRSE